MKKIVAIVLSIMMITSSSIIVSAETLTNTGNSEQNVTASYNASSSTPKYSVDITWGALKYEYAATGSWQPESNSYSWSVSKAWTYDSGANEIKLVNHSNRRVTATATFSSVDTYLNKYGITGMTGTFHSTKNAMSNATTITTSLDSAEGADYKNSYDEYETSASPYLNKVTDKLELTLTSNEPTKLGQSTTDETVGTVTITLSDP